MKKEMLMHACLLTLMALLLNVQQVLAHESITAGDYEIEVGWVSEPPIAGQLNGIEIQVTNISRGEIVEHVSALTVTLSYGGQNKVLTFEPVDADAPGQFRASVLPTIPGQYTVIFGGQLGDAPVSVHVEPEEVVSADTIQFPVSSISYPGPQSTAPERAVAGVSDWLVWLSLLLGLLGVGLGFTALRKK